MGIENVSIGKDYAAEFAAKTAGTAAESRVMAAHMTTPILRINPVESQPAVQIEPTANAQGRPYVTVEEVEERIQFEGENTDLNTARTLTDKKARKQLVEEKTKAILENGLADGTKVTDEKEARKLAEAMVENERYRESFYATRTYVDKAEYDKAEKARKEREKELVKEYRAAGMSKKDAKARAKSELVENQYVGNKKARKYMTEQEPEKFMTDGKLDQAKTKKWALDRMNSSTDKNEAENYHLGLKERRKEAARLEVDDDVVSDIVHRAAGDSNGQVYEKDYTEIIQGSAIAGAAAIGAGVGALLSTTVVAAESAAAAGASSSAGAAAAGAGAAAAAVDLTAAGAGVGAGVGLGGSRFLEDKGGKENKVYDIAEPKPEPDPDPVPNPDPDPDPNPVCELEGKEQHDVIQTEVPTCEYPVVPGDNWSKVVAAKYKVQTGTDEEGNPITRNLTPEEAKKVARELKMVHGIEKKDFGKCTFLTPFYKVVNGKRMYLPELERKGLLTEEDKQSEAYKKSVMTLPTEFEGLYAPELKDMKFVVDCDAKTDGKVDKGPAKGKVGTVGSERNVAQREHNVDTYWFEDCEGNRSGYFSSREERDQAQAAAQEARRKPECK